MPDAARKAASFEPGLEGIRCYFEEYSLLVILKRIVRSTKNLILNNFLNSLLVKVPFAPIFF